MGIMARMTDYQLIQSYEIRHTVLEKVIWGELDGQFHFQFQYRGKGNGEPICSKCTGEHFYQQHDAHTRETTNTVTATCGHCNTTIVREGDSKHCKACILEFIKKKIEDTTSN